MRFNVIPMRARPPIGSGLAVLETNNWDDYTYKTSFTLHYLDDDGASHNIGAVKIAHFDMDATAKRTVLPDEFLRLDAEYFSLGQDVSYYERLSELGEEVRDSVLLALRDVAADPGLFARALIEPVMGKSLLRDVPRSTVENQFRRVVTGGARLSPFSFRYFFAGAGVSVAFAVAPGSQPPSNVHVIIGRNGVGKSNLLNNIAKLLIEAKADERAAGRLAFDPEIEGASLTGSSLPTSGLGSPSSQFANLISVAFSAFDEFAPIRSPQDKSKGLQYTYIGLKRVARPNDEDSNVPKSGQALATEFGASVKACLQGSRLERWRRALEVLESDPIFADVEVANLADDAADDALLRENARELFRNLSSGHKIVLLTITRLVESIQEKSLVLLDEPESHLHPPLLSAFIRALSDLLTHRNGVAIVATHSPVVLQEVPRTCVWKLRRSGSVVAADRPTIETFGENVGILTQDVFGLEVTSSGFHRLIADAVREGATYDSVLATFRGELGGEARALVQALTSVSREYWRP